MKSMKNIAPVLLGVCCLLALVLSAFAAEKPASGAPVYTIRVGLEQKELDLIALPRQPYLEGDVLMVPLAEIADALGYQVTVYPASGTVTVDDGYIQKATLHDGSAAVGLESYLKVIDMSRTIENTAATVILDGCAYVPLSFFEEFFNDVQVDGTVIYVAPSMCELAATE